VDAPEMEPKGGQFNTQVVVRLLTAKLSATIQYRIIASTDLGDMDLTASALFGSAEKFSVAASGDIVTLPTYSCKVFALAVKEGMTDSALVVSDEYRVFRKAAPVV
jgi:hypothetical protein